MTRKRTLCRPKKREQTLKREKKKAERKEREKPGVGSFCFETITLPILCEGNCGQNRVGGNKKKKKKRKKKKNDVDLSETDADGSGDISRR